MPAVVAAPAVPTSATRARRRPALLLLAACAVGACAVGACASGGGTRGADDAGMGQGARIPRREVLMLEGNVLQYFPEAGSTPMETEVDVPVGRAWQVLPDAFEQLGLPLNEIQPSERQIGTGMMRMQGRVGRTSMSRVVDCGHTSGMANADAYAINLVVRSQVVPRGEARSTVRTLVLASGRQAATGGGSVVSCPTLGELERQIARLVREKAAAKGG